MGLIKLAIFALLCVGICQCVPLFPKRHKWEYYYGATASIGTQKPTYAATGMKFSGKLVVESFSNKVVVMKFSDMVSMYHNGGSSDLRGKDAPLEEEAKIIEVPFLVHYTGSKIDSIYVTPSEPIWALNMKKAVAGLFQLEMDELHEEAMYTEETNIYGKCSDIEYSVTNHTDTIQITKMFKFDKCKGSAKMFTTTTPFLCEPERASVASAKREYVMKMGEKYLVLKNVSSISERFVEGFFNKEGAYKMVSKQVIGLLKVSALPGDQAVPDSCTIKKDLIYEQTPHFELSHGRKPLSQEELIHLIKELSSKVVHRFEEKFVLDPNVLHQNSMQYMHWLMHSLTVEGFEKLYEEVSTGESCTHDMRKNIILELLPQIGTHDSLVFMKKMLMQGKFEWYFTLKMLAQYPFYVKNFSEELLVEMEEILHAKPEEVYQSYDDIFTNTAILSFSNLIYKTYSHSQCSTELYEKYVTKFFNYYSESKTYGKALIYMQALRNMQMGTVFHKFIGIIRNKELSYHFRFQAVWGLMPHAPKHPAEMYKLFWPILKDRKEHIEMRVMALKMLLLSEPTPARFFSIYWFMKGESCPQLYNLYYSVLYTMQYTGYPCYEELQTLSAKFVRYVKEPPKTKFEKFTEYFLTDYVNWEAKLGSMFQGLIIGEDYADMPNVGYFTMSKTGFGKNLERVSIFVKVNGLSDVANEKTPTGEEVNSYESILKMIKKADLKIRSPQEFHLEMFLEVHNKIVFSKFYDMQALMEQYPSVKNHFAERVSKCGNTFNVQFTTPPMITDYFDTTDFGTFAHIGFVRNSISSLRSNDSEVLVEQGIAVHGEIRYGNLDFFEQRMDHFNPISNVYQGIVKMKTTQFGIAAKLSSVLDMADIRNELKWEESNGNNGIILHQQTISYTANTDDILHKEKSKVFSVKYVTDSHKKKVINKDLAFPVQHLGVKIIISLFDFDQSMQFLEILKELKTTFLNLDEMEMDEDQVFEALTKVYDLLNYHVMEGRIGLAFRVVPLFDEPSVLQMSFKNVGSKLHDVNVKLGAKLYKEDSQEKPYYWWDMSVKASTNFGLMNNFKLKFSEQEWEDQKPMSVCVNYKLDYDGGDCKHPRADFYDLEPIKSAKQNVYLSWGPPAEEGCPKEHSIKFYSKGSISEEQIKAEKDADKWPFEQCKDHLKGRKFNPATEACYQSAVEMSTYRQYDNLLVVDNPPKWMKKAYGMYEAFRSVFENAYTEHIVPELKPIKENNTYTLKYTEILPFVEEDEDDTQFISDNHTQRVILSMYHLFGLFNPKTDRAEDVVSSWDDIGVCVVSPDVIRTYGNDSVTDFEKKDKYIVLTECITQPSYVIFMNQMEKGIKFHIVTTEGNIDMFATGENMEVTVYGEELDCEKTTENEHYYFEKHHDGYYFKLKDYNVEMTIRPEFTVITSPEDNTCGLCNLQYSEARDYVYSKHV